MNVNSTISPKGLKSTDRRIINEAFVLIFAAKRLYSEAISYGRSSKVSSEQTPGTSLANDIARELGDEQHEKQTAATASPEQIAKYVKALEALELATDWFEGLRKQNIGNTMVELDISKAQTRLMRMIFKIQLRVPEDQRPDIDLSKVNPESAALPQVGRVSEGKPNAVKYFYPEPLAEYLKTTNDDIKFILVATDPKVSYPSPHQFVVFIRE